MPDKPYSFSRALMIGAEVKPPTESPDNVKPIARARLLSKYCGTITAVGILTIHCPMPEIMKFTRICMLSRYFVPA